MGYAPASVIEPPVRVGLPYGLFSVASLTETATERWENGVTWEALTCDPAGVVVGDCEDPEGLPKDFAADNPIGNADAFTVYGVYKCGTFGGPLDRGLERARAVLLNREESAAESRLWAAMAADATATALPTGLDVIEILGRLEQSIATNYGSLGVIHANRDAATTLTQKGLVRPRNGRLETNLGTPVIAGGGYATTGIAGAAPADGTAYIAASPGLFGYRSEVFVGSNHPEGLDLLDRAHNTLYGIAERNYLLGYDPCGVVFAQLTLGVA